MEARNQTPVNKNVGEFVNRGGDNSVRFQMSANPNIAKMGVWRRCDTDSVIAQINAITPINDMTGKAFVINVSVVALLALFVIPDHASASQ